jgi:heme/copper-type cytochrome/quinol oxidase subunit 1
MAFMLAFIGAFIIGGITGVYNSYIPINYAIQDTYWVLGHFNMAEEISTKLNNDPKLSALDFLAWSAIIIVLFIIYLVIGNFGNYLEQISPVAERVGELYKVTFYAAGVIFSLFTGSLIFFTIKFWDRGRGD